MERKIGVFDSGIGGFTVLEKLKEVLPYESFIYYGDSKNNPYGEKTDEELYSIVRNVVLYLIDLDVKLIVIACNTATTKCIEKLKNEFSEMIFVGIVPAIEMVYNSLCKRTLVMATPATIKSELLSQLIKDYKREEQEFILLSCDGLAHLIEINNASLIDKRLNEIFLPYMEEKIDSIVLGCTHYPLIEKNIKKYFPNALLFDGSFTVAKEVKEQLEKNNLLKKEGIQEIKILNSLEL